MPSTRLRRAQPIPTSVGIGLRPAHIERVLEQRPAVPFFELHSENLFCAGGPMWDVFEQVRRDYPVSLHGVGLSLGGADALDPAHLRRLREVIARAAPALVSEHVCWGAIGGRHYNDLLPLPYTEEALALMVEHDDELQQALQRQVLLENVSSYIHYIHSTTSTASTTASTPCVTSTASTLPRSAKFTWPASAARKAWAGRC